MSNNIMLFSPGGDSVEQWVALWLEFAWDKIIKSYISRSNFLPQTRDMQLYSL